MWETRGRTVMVCAYVGVFFPHPYFSPYAQAPPVFLPVTASAAEKARVTALRRGHPLFQSVTLMLLTEIVNSRLFTTVRDTLGLTYDVSFEVSGRGGRGGGDDEKVRRSVCGEV